MEKKYTRFRDIPRFTSDGSWQCDASPAYLVEFIGNQKKEAGLNMEPDFQRGHVWTEEQQVKWLEYFLRGGKTTPIYLNCPSWNRDVPSGAYNEFVCVDGLQRYTAMESFVRGKIKVFGSYYHEYEDSRCLRNTIKVNVNDLKTRQEVLQWYIDINSGGTPHTKEEIDMVKWLLAEELENAKAKDFLERVTRKLLASNPELEEECFRFRQDPMPRVEYSPHQGGGGSFSVCLEYSGEVTLYGNLDALVPTVRKFRDLHDFEENV